MYCETSCSVGGWNVGCDWDGYDKTGNRREGNIKKDIWTCGRGRNIENKNWSGIEGAI